MRVTILCVGKIKEAYFTSAINEYTKRLSKFVKLEIIEVKDEKTPDKASPAEEAIIKKKEGERLLRYVKDGAYIFVLAVEGIQFSSNDFASKIDIAAVSGKSHIIFIIGGSLGLDGDIIKKADYLISFSKMVFPHQLMRVILLEQIYRGYKIINNEPYHK